MKLFLLTLMIALNLCPTPQPPAVNTEGLCIVEPVVKLSEPITMVATAYCGCSRCCGKSDGITATGTRATEGRTIAADPRYYPYGTKMLINGNIYTVEDCGGGIHGNRLDIYFDSHSSALAYGVQTVEAQIITEVEK